MNCIVFQYSPKKEGTKNYPTLVRPQKSKYPYRRQAECRWSLRINKKQLWLYWVADTSEAYVLADMFPLSHFLWSSHGAEEDMAVGPEIDHFWDGCIEILHCLKAEQKSLDVFLQCRHCQSTKLSLVPAENILEKLSWLYLHTDYRQNLAALWGGKRNPTQFMKPQ